MGSVIDANGNPEFGVVESDTTASDGSIEVDVSLSFVPPATIAANGPGTPLVDIAPQLSTGGTLTAGKRSTMLCQASIASGNEGPLSFIVRASVLADSSSVAALRSEFCVRYHDLQRLPRGHAVESVSDHDQSDFGRSVHRHRLGNTAHRSARPVFRSRELLLAIEQLPETAATIHSASTIGNSTLQMDVNSYRGMTLRITRGTGAGQEAAILSNTATTLTVSPAWVFAPDASSYFTVAESAWHFGAVANSSPVQFEIPNMAGDVVQLTGRSANANDVESPAGLAIVTRWQIGGSGGADTDVPAAPGFALNPGNSGGTVELSSVFFSDLSNTASISAGTLSLYYWDELQGTPSNGSCRRDRRWGHHLDAEYRWQRSGRDGYSDRWRGIASDGRRDRRHAIHSNARRIGHYGGRAQLRRRSLPTGDN